MSDTNKVFTGARFTTLSAAVALALGTGTAAATEVEIGGYVKGQVNWSDVGGTADRNDHFYIPSTVPLDGQEPGHKQLRFSARESRINFRTSTPTALGDLVTFFEVDSLGTFTHGSDRLVGQQNIRLRHAYGSLGPLLVGQTWSTFYDVSTKPETSDFVGAAGTIFRRATQVRWTQDLGGGQNIMLAAEVPFTTLTLEEDTGAPGTNLQDGRDDRFPDLIARYNASGDWGHGSIAVMARNLRAEHHARDVVPNADDDKWGGAITATAKINTIGRDDLRIQGTYGNAVGRYIALNAFQDGTIDADGKVDTMSVWGGYAAYRMWWTQNTRSNLVYGFARANNPSEIKDLSVNKRVQSVHVNVITSPVENTNFALEYIWAERQVEEQPAGADDDKGELNRVQFSAQYVF